MGFIKSRQFDFPATRLPGISKLLQCSGSAGGWPVRFESNSDFSCQRHCQNHPMLFIFEFL
jgi:hypothetical protein